MKDHNTGASSASERSEKKNNSATTEDLLATLGALFVWRGENPKVPIEGHETEVASVRSSVLRISQRERILKDVRTRVSELARKISLLSSKDELTPELIKKVHNIFCGSEVAVPKDYLGLLTEVTNLADSLPLNDESQSKLDKAFNLLGD